MGIPIEPRLSETARRKRQRHMAEAARNNAVRRLPQSPTRRFGINHDAIRAMAEYYNAQGDGAAASPRRGRLAVVRTVLPHPVRPHRSAFARLDSRISLLLTGAVEVVEYPPTLDSDHDAPSVDGSESDTASDPGATSDGVDDRLPWTSVAVSILYVEDCDNPRVWELGCWAGAHQLAGVDMFQVFLNVLTAATRVPACLVEALWIRDNLEVYVAVSEAIALLKELSAELHASYDKDSSYFLNPITAAQVEIKIDV